jgi:hypothetical protein
MQILKGDVEQKRSYPTMVIARLGAVVVATAANVVDRKAAKWEKGGNTGSFIGEVVK